MKWKPHWENDQETETPTLREKLTYLVFAGFFVLAAIGFLLFTRAIGSQTP